MNTYYTSLSGLNAAAHHLDTTANNIANVGSTGFKRYQSSFQDIFSATAQEVSADETGGGVKVAGNVQIFTQGALQSSQNQLNLAVVGEGFFTVKSNLRPLPTYTRDGQFSINNDNLVVNGNGDQLMVAATDSLGNARSGQLTGLRIPPETSGMAKTTGQVNQVINLPTTAKVISAPFDANDPSTYNLSQNIDLIDDSGTVRQGRLYYVRTKGGSENDLSSEWRTVLTVDGQTIQPTSRNYPVTDIPARVDQPTYIEWTGTGNANQQMQIAKATTPNIKPDAITVVGTKVFVGNGVTAQAIGELDSQLNGQDGKSLRINLYQSQFTNSSFNQIGTVMDPIPGWQVLDQQLKLNGGSEIAGWPTPTDQNPPPGSPGDQVTSLDGHFMVTPLNRSTNGATGVQLSSQGSIDQGGGVVHGPGIVSQEPVVLAAGSQISFDWRASGGTDSYDVKAYLLNVDTGETVSLLDRTGQNAGAQTDWATVTTDVSKAGRYKFVFISGSYDQTSGMATGADLYIDNIKTPKLPGVLGQQFNGLVSRTTTLEDNTGLLRFTPSGDLIPELNQLTFESPYGTSRNLTLNMEGSGMKGASFAINSMTQDGQAEGKLESLEVATTGLVQATYSNGAQVNLGKVMLANFTNTAGLTNLGDGQFSSNINSGNALLSEAGANGSGTIRSGSIELSNVDLTMELTQMILAQRNFQANAKAIETTSTMVKSVIDSVR